MIDSQETDGEDKPRPSSSHATRSARRVALILPALNEEQALPLVLSEIPAQLVTDIVVVDNGSTDNTAAVARAGGARVVHEPQRGYGRACLAGLALLNGDRPPAAGEQPMGALADSDWVVFLDADHSDYPEDLADLLGPLAADQADFVLGSRIQGGASLEAMLPQAWFGNKLSCFLMRWLFGARYTDLGPFRAIRMDALRHLRMRDEDYGWTVEMQLKAQVAGLRVLEVPVRYRPRIGTSKVTGTWRGTLGAGSKILGWIFGWRLRLWFSPRCIPKFPRSAHSGSTGSQAGSQRDPDRARH